MHTKSRLALLIALWLTVALGVAQAMRVVQSSGHSNGSNSSATNNTAGGIGAGFGRAASDDDDDESKGLKQEDADEETAADDDENEAPERDASEGSRISGGTPIKTKVWNSGSWYHPKRQQYRPDGLFAGHMIRLNKDRVLTHGDTCLEPQAEWGGEKYGKQIILEMPDKIDIHTGHPRGERMFGCTKERGYELKNNFGVYHLTPEYGSLAQAALRDSEGTLKLDELQHDPSVTDDCVMHSYSSGQAEIPRKQAIRVFSAMPLQQMRCDGDFCRFQSKSAERQEFCPDTDRGAPIMCGKAQKLSFVAMTNQCETHVDALKLANYHRDLSSAITDKTHFERLHPIDDAGSIPGMIDKAPTG